MNKVVIVGSGPAAWTAAVYAARANLSPLVIPAGPGRASGGQLMTTTDVENFPGYPSGVQGPDLVRDIRDQALKYGARIQTDDGPQTSVSLVEGDEVTYHWQSATSVDLSVRPFVLTTDGGDTIKTETLIVATGATAKYLGLPSEQSLLNQGVSACAVCDGPIPRFRNQPVVVVGGGDSAMEEALYLARFASTVYLVHRRDSFRASQVMQERVFSHPKIRVLWNREVTEVLGDEEEGVTGVLLRSTSDGEDQTIRASGLFLAIGHTPSVGWLQGQLRLTSSGYIWTSSRRTDTSVPGVFAAGDVADDWYRQAITAAGTGAAAALDAERYLAGIE